MTFMTQLFQWTKSEEDSDLNFDDIDKALAFKDNIFKEYEPCIYGDSFRVRLENWLKNLVDEPDEQKQLFILMKYFSFISRREMDALYRSAFTNIIVKWLMDNEGYDFETEGLSMQIEGELKKTWFCPGSDSMRISQFFHINNIQSEVKIRPDWFSLASLDNRPKDNEPSDMAKIVKNFSKENGIKNLVIIEDFVGSGTQMSRPLCVAAKTDLRILFIPLVLAEYGLKKLLGVCSKNNITFAPLVVLEKSNFINCEKHESEPKVYEKIREISQKYFSSRLKNENVHIKKFGFGNMGNTCILFSNCPNNSLPLFFQKTDNWSPLFPRAGRG